MKDDEPYVDEDGDFGYDVTDGDVDDVTADETPKAKVFGARAHNKVEIDFEAEESALIRTFVSHQTITYDITERVHPNGGSRLIPVVIGSVGDDGETFSRRNRNDESDTRYLTIGRNQIEDWVNGHCSGIADFYRGAVWFENESDAVAFKMWLDHGR